MGKWEMCRIKFPRLVIKHARLDRWSVEMQVARGVLKCSIEYLKW